MYLLNALFLLIIARSSSLSASFLSTTELVLFFPAGQAAATLYQHRPLVSDQSVRGGMLADTVHRCLGTPDALAMDQGNAT